MNLELYIYGQWAQSVGVYLIFSEDPKELRCRIYTSKDNLMRGICYRER